MKQFNEKMKRILFKILFYLYITLLILFYIKLLPEPANFISTRYVMLLRRESGWWEYNLTPFNFYKHISENYPKSLYLIIGHIFTFMALGILFFLAYRNFPAIKRIIILTILAIFIEVIQFVFAVGVFDIDTIIQHCLGATLSILLIYIIKKYIEKLKIKKDVCNWNA